MIPRPGVILASPSSDIPRMSLLPLPVNVSIAQHIRHPLSYLKRYKPMVHYDLELVNRSLRRGLSGVGEH